MNAPNRFELYVLNDGEKAFVSPRYSIYLPTDCSDSLEVIDDTKIPNAATIKIVKQDHTMANMIRTYIGSYHFQSDISLFFIYSQLLAHPNVIFAGYKVPHPLEPHFLLKIQTDGTVTPSHAFKTACELLLSTITNLTAAFKNEFLKASGPDDALPRQPQSIGLDAYGLPLNTNPATQGYADM